VSQPRVESFSFTPSARRSVTLSELRLHAAWRRPLRQQIIVPFLLLLIFVAVVGVAALTYQATSAGMAAFDQSLIRASVQANDSLATLEAGRLNDLRALAATPGLAPLVTDIERSKFAFPQSATDVVAAALSKTGAGYPDLLRDLFKYLSNLDERGARPNREAQLVSRFAKAHAAAQVGFKKSGVPVKEGRISCVFPPGGMQDNTVNRLLLMSSSERHISNVPMAFFIEPADDPLVDSRSGEQRILL